MLRLATFVNADVIAQGLSGFDPESMAFEAGRIMLHRLKELADQRANFAFETTLAGRNYARWFRSWRQAGYTIHLVYLRLESADLAVARVAQRVSQGGHSIAEETVRQRYQRGLVNFFQLYRPLVNNWAVYENSHVDHLPELAAYGDERGNETILMESVWQQMQQEVSRG
jgi:predicted ABC-type ATPase